MKIDLVFLLVIFVFAIYYMGSTKNIENMANVTDDIKEGIRQVYLADVDAIRNLSEVAKKLQAGGLVNPGNLTVNGFINSTSISRIGGDWLRINNEGGTNGRTALYGNLSVNGIMDGHSGLSVGTWGDAGEGNIKASGNITAGSINTNTGIRADNPIANGWISGTFGLGNKDRVVIGNLDNQAAVGAHNNALNAWTALRLQGDSINMVPNNGIVNFPNGWRINTSDGHFRIQKDGQDKLVAHNAGHPVYAPNGMDVGNWVGTGGGTLNVSGNANIAKGLTAGNKDGNVVRYGDPMAFNMPYASNDWWLSEHNGGVRAREHRGGFSVWAPRKA